jgi:cell division protein FtsB
MAIVIDSTLVTVLAFLPHMPKYNITENNKRAKYTPLTKRGMVIALLVLVLLFSARAAWRAYRQMRTSSEVTLNAEKELSELEVRKEFIEGELDKLSTAAGREEKLREKFGVGRPGEQVAIIIEGQVSDDTPSDDDLWIKVRSFFKTLFQK